VLKKIIARTPRAALAKYPSNAQNGMSKIVFSGITARISEKH